MTPEEKAKELFDKISKTGKVEFLLHKEEINDIALICVDEILDSYTTGETKYLKYCGEEAQDDFKYWQQVKECLTNL